MLEKMKKVMSGLSVMAASYMPKGFKDSLLEMAAEIDRLRADVNTLRSQTDDGK